MTPAVLKINIFITWGTGNFTSNKQNRDNPMGSSHVCQTASDSEDEPS
jgi:hypothetical protein